MKHFKFILVALCLFTGATANAQKGGRMPTGNIAPYTSTAMHLMTPAGVVKTRDTLVGNDTGYAYIWVGQGFSTSIDLLVSTLTSTVTTTSYVLYGINGGGVQLTPAQLLAAQKFAITGNTTYCAGCVGASSTTVPGSATHYVWQAPNNAGALFDNYLLMAKHTGTATATYSATIQTQY